MVMASGKRLSRDPVSISCTKTGSKLFCVDHVKFVIVCIYDVLFQSTPPPFISKTLDLYANECYDAMAGVYRHTYIIHVSIICILHILYK